MRNDKGQFLKGRHNGLATEFKKGDIPFNKGLKQTDWMTEEAIKNTVATRFKKGQLPHNSNPEGTVRRHTHKRYGQVVGYDWFININWKGERSHNYGYRKYLWEVEYQQDAPKGMIFVAKDGDQQKMPTIENVEMISRAENIRRNSPKL